MVVPVVIICRDRCQALQDLVAWLERAGVSRIVLLDNDSAYEPLLEYFTTSPHEVVRLRQNVGPRAPWLTGLADSFRTPYVVTDPDVVPAQECPLDALDFMACVLHQHPEVSKVGLGLKVDDLPEHYPFRDEVRVLESEFHRPDRQVGPSVWRSPVDTTFALYRPRRRFTINHALRLSSPYVAQHRPWYEDPSSPSPDEVFYRARASAASNFDPYDFPAWLQEHVDRIRQGAYHPPALQLSRPAQFWERLAWEALRIARSVRP